MSPAAPGLASALPSRSEIEEWPTQHLDDAATQLRSMGTQSVALFDEHRQSIIAPGGTTWEGDAKDAALNRVTADTAVVRRQTSVQDEAANIAENGSHDVQAAKREALEAITAAENDGFKVGEDLTVTDTRTVDRDSLAARQTAATEHAEDIRWYAERLVQADTLVGERLQTKAAELEGIRFDGEGDGRDGTVQFVDNETEDPAPETDTGEDTGTGDADDPDADSETGDPDTPADDGPKSQHPDYPNRNRDGTYRDDNSVDGKAAEKAALDKREEETGITLDRRQVKATHPDVNNRKTGKPQGRYYDALEPTDNPDEYIGIEAKTHEGVDRTPDQKRFDGAVSPERPATAVVDGREVRIVGTDLAHPPEGWDDAPAESDEPTESGGADTGGGAEAKVPGPALPPALTDSGAGDFGGVHAEGTVPVSPAPTNAPNYPGWGTQLTPQEMINSDDPGLRVAGQAILEQMRREGRIDPSSTA